MLSIPNVLSLLFFIVFLLYAAMAIYLITVNVKYDVNKTFALTMFCHAVWAFGFSMSVNAPTIEKAMYMRRIGSIGGSLVFGFYLHTILLLTGNKKKSMSLLKLAILYLMPVFSFVSITCNIMNSGKYYDLVFTNYGWQNIGNIPIIIYISYAHIVVYMQYGFYRLLKWRRSTDITREKEQAKIMGISLIVTSVINATTDIFIPYILKIPFPEIGIVIAVFPMYSTWRAIIKYKIQPISTAVIANELIDNMNEGYLITDATGFITHANTYLTKLLDLENRDLSNIHFTELFGDVPDNMFNYFNKVTTDGSESEFRYNIEKKIFNLSNLKNQKEIDINTFVVMMSIASFFDINGMFKIGCIILSDITERKKYQSILEHTRNSMESNVNKRTEELKLTNENLEIEIALRERRNALENLLFITSRDFINIDSQNADLKINSLLSGIGKFFDVDTASIIKFNHDISTMGRMYSWRESNADIYINSGKEIPTSNYHWSLEKLSRGVIYIENVDDLPNEASNEKQFLLSLNIKTAIGVPMISNNAFYGFLKLDTIGKIKVWKDDDMRMLILLTNTLMDGITKVEDQNKIYTLAYYDSLTQLPNKSRLYEILDEIIITKPNSIFALLYFDLDSFKNVNDSLGHDAGDILIKILTKEMVKTTKSIERVFRIGGDEFVIVLDDLKSKNSISHKLSEILGLFNRNYIIKEQVFFVTSSIGISFFPDDGNTPNEIFGNADIALYQAKKLGKNRHIFCSKELKDENAKNIALTKDLGSALENNELFIMYQPQIDLITRKLTGVEALLRWRHTKLGIIPPSVFIPLAEDSGLIIPIGWWILEQAIIESKNWQAMGLRPITMSVNLSISQFFNDRFAQNISDLIDKHSFEPSLLELEITESISMDKNSYILDTLYEFKKIGIKIAIDDFGTQYSSLSRIKELPIDTLKIAMDFVQNLEDDHKNREIANIIISIAKNLNLKLIAEGAENEYQIKYLEDKFVDVVQGYYFYKPLSSEQIINILKE